MKDFIVRQSVAIKASPAQVWEALTQPEMTKKYFFHCRVYSDWKEGSSITFKGKLFFFFPITLTGQILEIEKEKRLKYTLSNSGSTSHSTVTDELHYQNGTTTLSISDEVGQGEGAEKRYTKSVKGWNKVLKGLKKIVEENQPS